MADGEVADRPHSGALSPESVRGTESLTLGEALRRARQQRGLTAQQISATTKIPVRHLEALERDDIHAVPGGMYLRAEIRAYADAVGLNRSVALGYLQAALEPPSAATAGPDTPSPASRRTVLRRTVMVAGCLVAASAAVMWWRMENGARQTPLNRVVSEAPPAPEPARTATATVARSASTPAPANDTRPQPSADAAPPGVTSGTTGSAPVRATEGAGAPTDQPVAAPAGVPELEIVTEPAGARVTIDGVGWGVTPLTIRYLPPGAKQLRVTRDGFAAAEQVIRFGTGGQARTSVRITLHQAE